MEPYLVLLSNIYFVQSYSIFVSKFQDHNIPPHRLCFLGSSIIPRVSYILDLLYTIHSGTSYIHIQPFTEADAQPNSIFRHDGRIVHYFKNWKFKTNIFSFLLISYHVVCWYLVVYYDYYVVQNTEEMRTREIEEMIPVPPSVSDRWQTTIDQFFFLSENVINDMLTRFFLNFWRAYYLGNGCMALRFGVIMYGIRTHLAMTVGPWLTRSRPSLTSIIFISWIFWQLAWNRLRMSLKKGAYKWIMYKLKKNRINSRSVVSYSPTPLVSSNKSRFISNISI